METALASIPAPALVLRHAAIQATYAPSIYNTQPWYLRLAPTDLGLHADPARWLMSLDRLGRQLMISCGCALFNARASAAADGWDVVIDRSTADLATSNLIATIRVADPEVGAGDPELAELNFYIQGHSQESPSLPPLVDAAELIGRLQAAAAAEGVELIPILEPEFLMLLTDAVGRAEQQYRRDQDARTDRWAWAGVFSSSEWSSIPVRSGGHVLTAALCTRSDTPRHWVSAGEGLQRILLELSRSGYAADLSIPAIEVAEVRSYLRDLLGLEAFPQVLLQLGPAAAPSSVPQRRLLVDVIQEAVEP